MAQRVEGFLNQLSNAQPLIQRPREETLPTDLNRPTAGPAVRKRPAGAEGEPAPKPQKGVSPELIVSLRPRQAEAPAEGGELGLARARAALVALVERPAPFERISEVEFDAARVRDILIHVREPVSESESKAVIEKLSRIEGREAPTPEAPRSREAEAGAARVGARTREAVPQPERNPFVRGPVAERLGVVEKPPEAVNRPIEVEEAPQRPAAPRRLPVNAEAERPAPPVPERAPAVVEERPRREPETPAPGPRLQEALQQSVASASVRENVSGLGDIRPTAGR
ncbi:MAG: hypothetical protein HYT87_06635 [Nitrospirae bacterium]|nr:hypothetical protein [Nitrospirota bacterium]